MEFDAIFINFEHWDYYKGDIHKVGCKLNAYDEHQDRIIEVMCSKADYYKTEGADLSFGDPIKLRCIPNGRYVNYEVA